jgi:glycosyltransferase involved in cell wall biosynthesis
MRFCMVTTFYPPYHLGGDAVYVQALARALRRIGHEVEVVHCEDAFRIAGRPAPPAPAAEDDGIVVHRLHSAWGGLSPLITQQTGRPGLKHKPLAAILGRGFDVIHFHNISLVGGPGVLSLGHARAKLYSLHEHWLLCPTHIFWKNRERACDRPTCFSCCLRSGIPPQLWRLGDLIARELEHVDVLFAPSEFTARKHREAGISRPIEILPLFSRIEGRRENAPAQTARPRFLFVGRVTAAKGIRQLVEAFARLSEYDLDVAGEGELRLPLEREFAAAPNVRFLGGVRTADLSALYASATATIIPSLAPETFGLVAVESFACSTPVLALEAGGCGEVVRASEAGVVCADMAALVVAVRRLAGDPGLAAAMGRSGRKAYEEKYTEGGHVSALLDRVEALLASAPRRGPA